MSLSKEIAELAEEVGNYRYAVVKSRNRYREVTGKMLSFSQRLQTMSKEAKDAQSLADINTTMLEEIGELFKNRHLVIPEGESDDRKLYIMGLMASIPNCVEAFRNCAKESSPSEDCESGN